jgi:hypothetical protein
MANTEKDQMDSTGLLVLLAKHAGSYILDDFTSHEIILKDASGADMKIYESDGREISSRFPYALVEGLIGKKLVAPDQGNGRMYRLTKLGRRAVPPS